MSISQFANQIASADREIHSLENQIHVIDSRIAAKHREVTAVLDKISRERDIKRQVTHLKEQTRKNEELSRLEKDKSTKSKALADKMKKRTDLQIQMSKEEQKERDKAKREQAEVLSIQKEITREIERQKAFSLKAIELYIPRQEKGEKKIREYDVFISHASEDKDDFVRPFAESLKEKGLIVWYDELELKIGDRLRRSIDNGLKNSRYGIVVLSSAFFNKEWPQRELDGLFAREVNGQNVILPIWHKVSKDEVIRYSPIIADLLALNTASFTIEEISSKINERVSQR